MKSRMNIQQIQDYYEKNEQKLAVWFFIGGFLLDLVMLDTIDSWATIGQQVFYLVLIHVGLMQLYFEEGQPPRDLTAAMKLKRWYFDYRVAAIHFCFGALLNSYTLLFFKSSSLVTSMVFLACMTGLLIANESQRFKNLGLAVKFAMLGLSYLAFAACVVPIAIGSLGLLVFLLSMMVGSLPLIGTGWWVQKKSPELFERAKKQILMPMGLVLLGFLSLYSLKLIPPVPLSIPFIGVYHSVERVTEGYKLSFEKPWWRFWHNGDQDFAAQRGDKIYVFFRIFSPTRFADTVNMRWYWKDNRAGWILQDTIQLKIVGGRVEGFRGFGIKSNYQPGEWKVQVETLDDREIGRVYFDLEIAPEAPRTFDFEVM
jgi:hypothetical protein